MTSGDFLFFVLAAGIVGHCITAIVARLTERKERK